jgi:CheY-like chemotaxis protein
VEPALRPLDPEAVLVALGAGAGRGTKVVTIGTDVDALMSLRQIFARQGLSVSMAWDVKQAADLLGMIHPELVVVDLEQPPRVGYGIVARLAGAEPIPTTVLISSGEKDPAAGFRTALADPAHNPRVLTLGRVLGQLTARAADQKKAKS